MKNYYYVENGQQLGPFTIEELKSKPLKKSNLVWTDGLPEWTKAESLDELKDILISEPPPLPETNNIKEIETIQIKQPIQSPNSDKYDNTYATEDEATYLGIVIIAIILAKIIFFGKVTFVSVESYLKVLIITFIIRIAITFWVVKIATRQNRNSTGWGWFAFFLPTIALIVIGKLKKLRLKIELDGSLPTNELVTILIEKANQLFSDKRYSESVEILNKANELDKENFDCIILRGQANYQLKKYEKAKSDFEALIKSENSLSIANLFLGDIALKNFKRELAIKYWLEAIKYDNAEAKKKLDMYHNFTHKYLINSNQIQNKLGPKNEFPFIENELSKYEGGLPFVDNELKLKSKKIQINKYQNGIDLEFRVIFKVTHIAIAFYEIENIIIKEKEKIFEFHLTDKIVLSFSYDKLKDISKGLENLFHWYEQETGKIPDASTSWKELISN